MTGMTQESINLIRRIFVNSRIRIGSRITSDWLSRNNGNHKNDRLLRERLTETSDFLTMSTTNFIVILLVLGSWVAAKTPFVSPFILICFKLITKRHLVEFSRFSFWGFYYFTAFVLISKPLTSLISNIETISTTFNQPINWTFFWFFIDDPN